MEANKFVPIRVSTLRGDLEISFDAYVQVAGKFILYCRKGESFEGDRLTRIRAKKLKKLFIPFDQEGLYRHYMTESIEKAYTDKSKPMSTRGEVIQGAQQAAAEEVMEQPESIEAYNMAKQGTKKLVDFLLNEPESIKTIVNLENFDYNMAHHGVTVATLAVALANKMGLLDEDEKGDILALGALLHDFEHYHSGLNLARHLDTLSPAEMNIYKKHPATGAEKVKDLNHFDPLVIKIIHQHHEFIDGSGFPKGLREKDLDPLVMIVGTVNSYERLTAFEKKDPKDALKCLLIDKMGLHPLDQLKALQDVLKEKQVID